MTTITPDTPTALTRYMPLVGRILVGTIFPASGLGEPAAPGARIGSIQAAGLPLPQAAFAVAAAVEIGGSLTSIAGYGARIVALVLALFTIAAALGLTGCFVG